jgi:hypothetical protein
LIFCNERDRIVPIRSTRRKGDLIGTFEDVAWAGNITAGQLLEIRLDAREARQF